MRIEWQVAPGSRCDIVTYSACNLSGKRGQVRIFPSGSRKGEVRTEDVRSMVIRAPHGTRVLLLTSGGAGWEETPWRCIEIGPGASMPSERAGGLPGVRIPDLDLLDDPASKRTNPDVQATYPFVERLAEGHGWTFGRGGGLKGRVQIVRIERDRGESEAPPLAAERVARAVLRAIAERAPDALEPVAEAAAAALAEELAADGVTDAAERARRLATWASELA